MQCSNTSADNIGQLKISINYKPYSFNQKSKEQGIIYCKNFSMKNISKTITYNWVKNKRVLTSVHNICGIYHIVHM